MIDSVFELHQRNKVRQRREIRHSCNGEEIKPVAILFLLTQLRQKCYTLARELSKKDNFTIFSHLHAYT